MIIPNIVATNTGDHVANKFITNKLISNNFPCILQQAPGGLLNITNKFISDKFISNISQILLQQTLVNISNKIISNKFITGKFITDIY